MKLETEEDFKALPGLRWRLDSDRSVIAICAKQKLRKDFLFFQGPGKLGIYYERASRRGATNANAWWRKRLTYPTQAPDAGVLSDQPGDYDGVILFAARDLLDIPREFFKSRSRAFGRKALSVGVSGSNFNDSGSP